MTHARTVVCLLKIPAHFGARQVTEERAREIGLAGAESVKLEKYWSFRLLSAAAERFFGVSLQPHRAESGRWEADGLCFSLSHSGGYAAVALAKEAVGVDIQATGAQVSERLIARALTDGEKKRLDGLTGEARKAAFLRIFSEKESVFKMKGERVFRPERIDAEGANAREITAFGLTDAVLTLAKDPASGVEAKEKTPACYRAAVENDEIIFDPIS